MPTLLLFRHKNGEFVPNWSMFLVYLESRNWLELMLFAKPWMGCLDFPVLTSVSAFMRLAKFLLVGVSITSRVSL